MNKLIFLIVAAATIVFAQKPRVYVALDPQNNIASLGKLKIILVAEAKKGSKFKFPKIKDIGGYSVKGRAKGSVSYRIAEVKDKKVALVKRTLTLTIAPEKSFDMPSFSVFVNKKEYKSVPFRVSVLAKKSSSKKSSKKRVVVKEKKSENITKKPKKSNESSKIKKEIVAKEKKVVKKPIVSKTTVEEKVEQKREQKSVDIDDKKIESYQFKISSSKSEVVEGESFIVKVVLKEPIELSGGNIDYTPPLFTGFNSIPLGDGKTTESSSSITRVIEYLLTPKSAGKYKITPATASISMENAPEAQTPFGFFGGDTQSRVIKSNSLNIKVSAKPAGSELVGRFIIKEIVESKEAKSDKPFNFVVVLHGYGNLDGFELIKSKVTGLIMYEEDAKVEHKLENGKLISSYMKKYIFISDKDFVIPSFKVKVYDPQSKKVITLGTKEYHIKVNKTKNISTYLSGDRVPVNHNIDKVTESIVDAYSDKNSSKRSSSKEYLKAQMLLFDKDYYKKLYTKDSYSFINLVIALSLGVLAGVLVSIFGRKVVKLILFKKEKSKRDYEESLRILYPHITTNKKIESMVEKLYEVTNGNQDIVIDNSELDKLIKSVKNSS